MIYRYENEKEYRENPSVSQSQLKLLLAGVEVFNNVEPKEKYYEEKQHFIIGSAVDCIITQGLKVFNKSYCVSDLENKPSASIMSVIKETYDIEVEKFPDLTDFNFVSDDVKKTILDVAERQDFQRKWKDETKYNKIIEQGSDYWNDLIKAKGRQILSLEQYSAIKEISDSILDHPYTSKYFKDSENIDIYFQMPIYFTYEKIDCKALLDMVIVNHFEKTIQIIDIKTMGDYITNFPISFARRRYDFQAAFYTEAMKSFEWEYPNYTSDYTLLPFKFIVESTINPKTPVVFTCSDNILSKGKYGIPEERIGNHVFRRKHGFVDAIKLYIWHNKNGFDNDKIIVENEGNLLLDLEGIVLK